MTNNLDRMTLVDMAWNERRWDDYGAFLAEGMVAYRAGDEAPHDKRQHVRNAVAFCERFPDARVELAPYLDHFTSADGAKTCSIARLIGSSASPDGKGVVAFNVSFTTLCEWRSGQIVHQRSYLDRALMLSQLRGEGDPAGVRFG